MKPCVKCGSTEKYKSGKCKPCCRKYHRKYKKAIKEQNKGQKIERKPCKTCGCTLRYASGDCIDCSKRRASDWHNIKLQSEGAGTYQKNKTYKAKLNKYKITDELFRELLNNQQGLCAICKNKPVKDIDHDHVSGIVRGLLCRMCNVGLGCFFESTDNLKSAIDYLTKINNIKDLCVEQPINLNGSCEDE